MPIAVEVWSETEQQHEELGDANTMKRRRTHKEGNMRLVNEFPINEFPHSVCKWVRPNHVQTDEHWTRNWKKAELIGNKY